MASNSIPQGYDALVSLSEDAADGAQQHGMAISLAQNTETKIRADLIALIGDATAVPPVPGAQPLYNTAKAAKTAASSVQRTAESNARAFAAKAVGVLKAILGTQWNSAWAAAGFNSGSLAIPSDPLPLLGELRAYFAANPANEVTPVLGVTAAACQAQATALSDARSAVNDATVALGQAKQARDAAQVKLSKRMSGLLAELGQLLNKDDPLWYAFGFDRPADGQQPGPVQNLVLTAGGPGIVLVNWDDARRAERYRLLKQVAGTDPAPVLVTGTLYENELTLQGLPSGQSVKITVLAVNAAGDGPATVSSAFSVA
jgi:hypothetical protein